MDKIYYRKNLLSLLQKSIRRREVESALHAAKELDVGGYSIWDKILVYSAEDIGPASPGIAKYVEQKRKEYSLETHCGTRRGILMNTIKYLCLQHKSRIVDNAVHAYFKKVLPELSDHNDLAFQFQTSLKNRDSDLALRVAAHLYHQDQESLLIKILWENQSDEETTRRIQHFSNALKVTRNRFDLLFLVDVILHQTLNIPLDVTECNAIEITPLLQEEVSRIYNQGRVAVSDFPDWVYDKHTVKGKRLGRGMQHFYDVGALLVDCHLLDPYESIARRNNCASG